MPPNGGPERFTPIMTITYHYPTLWVKTKRYSMPYFFFILNVSSQCTMETCRTSIKVNMARVDMDGGITTFGLEMRRERRGKERCG